MVVVGEPAAGLYDMGWICSLMAEHQFVELEDEGSNPFRSVELFSLIGRTMAF
jgi:hypothetical protein